MKAWSVIILGEGFLRASQECNFELTGVVHAVDPNAAFQRAVTLAKARHVELSQADLPRPGPVINADEINEASNDNVEDLQLIWISPSEV